MPPTTIDRFKPFAAEKTTRYRKKQYKIIFLDDNARLYTGKLILETLEELNWEVLPMGLTYQLGSFQLPLVCIDGSAHTEQQSKVLSHPIDWLLFYFLYQNN